MTFQTLARLQQQPFAGQPTSLQSPDMLFVRQNNSPTLQPIIRMQQNVFQSTELKLSRVSSLIKSAAGFLQPRSWQDLQIVQAAKSIVGAQFRSPSLGNGTLACAWTVSTALENAGLISKKTSGCDVLKGILSKEGFHTFNTDSKNFNPNLYSPGDVVFFGKNSSGHGHVGIISKVERQPNGQTQVYMTHNSSTKREVVDINLNNYYRHPISIYRKP